MWKDSKAMIRNVMIYFIPFIIMTIVAVYFLHHSFLMMQGQNMSMTKIQTQNILNDVEESLSYSVQIAKDMCVDSTLRRKNMEENNASTMLGISQMLTYKSRMELCSTLFLNYSSERMITESGVSNMNVFLHDQIQLSEDGEKQFYLVMEREQPLGCGILQRRDGSAYLMLLYYFPESVYIEEQRIGFLIDAMQIDAQLKQILEKTNSLAVVKMNNQEITTVNCLNGNYEKKQIDQMVTALKEGKSISGFTSFQIKTDYMNLSMCVAINSGELKKELVKEEIKMAIIGIIVFLAMSLLLWNYGRYRYQMLNEIKQFAVSHHPELEKDANENEYRIIRKVLEKDLEKLSRKDEDFRQFKEEAKKQLTWLLLTSTPPNELDIEELMESYDIPEGGPYYCVLQFLLERRGTIEETDILAMHHKILMEYITETEQGKLVIVGVSLNSRDDEHKERMEIVQSVRAGLFARGYHCKKTVSGLVYGNIREIHSSQQEALTLIQENSLLRCREETLFFDERVHMTKRVPHVTTDLLEQFRESLANNDAEHACNALTFLMAPPKDMAVDLVVYTRYKVVSILMEMASEKGISDAQIRNMVNLSDLESDNFETEIKSLVIQNFGQVQAKSLEIEEIITFIEEHYVDTEISQEMVAEHFGSNVRSIRRIMKREIGKTYKEYLNEIRVTKACELLEETDWTIRQIAKDVGYYEVASFYRTFKLVMEMTPDEYRSSKRGIESE